MIKITYDSEVDAKYVSIKKGKVYETKTIEDWLFFDMDEKGSVLGIEILDASKNQITISSFENEVVQVGVAESLSKGKFYEKITETENEYVNSESATLMSI